MKKRLLILLTLVFTLFTLASCNIGNKPTEKPDVGEEDDFDFNNITLLSAYSKAQDLGFSGTLEEFVEMLSGKDGADGKDGKDGIGIEKVEFDKDGNLLITYTDGSSQTVTVPKKEEHVHKFGEWKKHTYGLTVPCDELISFRICSECSYTEWKEGTESDHSYPTEYKCEGDFHWKECIFCGNVTEKGEHALGEDDICTVCYSPITDTVGVIYNVSLDGTYAEVVDYQGTATKVKIASEYEGLPVKTIYKNAFRNKDNITSVFIPDSVELIGSYAFYKCSSLASVVIGDGVTSIGDYAFCYCTSLTSITFENTEGWWVSRDSDATSGMTISATDLANPSTAARYLMAAYYDYYWFCDKE
jgi:hypothetical protein